MLDLALYFMGYPEPEWVLAQTFRDFMGNQDFKGPWGIPDVAGRHHRRGDGLPRLHPFQDRPGLLRPILLGGDDASGRPCP